MAPRDDDDDDLGDEEAELQGEEGDALEESGSGAYRMNCRMYENEFPEIDDVVMVQVRSIAEMGAYVALLEYNNTEGMILLSEVSRRRIRSINKLIRVGKQEVCMVLRVDRDKGYIDLSKRRVSPEDVAKCDERFQRSKAVHSIVRHVSEITHIDMEALYRQTAWPLYQKFGHAYEAFCAAISDPDSIFNEQHMPGLSPDLRAAMLENIAKRLTPTAIKVGGATACRRPTPVLAPCRRRWPQRAARLCHPPLRRRPPHCPPPHCPPPHCPRLGRSARILR